jgi:putative photosynthetic complex assembly protein
MPRGVLFGAAALLAFALLVTVYGRTKDVGAVHMPAAQPYQTLLLTFADQNDGGITITDASSSAVLLRIAPETNGFLRSVMRGFAHARERDGIGPEAPFKLVRWSTGAMSLIDDKTGRRIDLDAFGSNQTRLFAQLLQASKPAAP